MSTLPPGTGMSTLPPGTGMSTLPPGTGMSTLPPGTRLNLHGGAIGEVLRHYQDVYEVRLPDGEVIQLTSAYVDRLVSNGAVRRAILSRKKPSSA